MADIVVMSKSAKKRAAKAARDAAHAEQNPEVFATAAEKQPASKAAAKLKRRSDRLRRNEQAAKSPEQKKREVEAVKQHIPKGDAKAQEVIRKAEDAKLAARSCVSLNVVPGAPLISGNDVPVLVSVMTPEGTGRTPSDIVVVLDISGSMGMEAKILGAGGATESNGLSLLDVAKHGVRTVVRCLRPQDRFALVLFNNAAQTAVPLTVMDEIGQKAIEDKLEEIASGGGTDIWTGLASALEQLEKAEPHEPARLAHIMLLTDGESQNRNQIVPNLAQYKEAKERLPATVSTFGFGYNIDSTLLIELANHGEGTYSFVPDAGFVGTVFVNTLSNLLVTFAREACLKLEPEEGVAKIVSVRGGYQPKKTSWGMSIPIGTLQYSQRKDIIVIMRVSEDDEYLTVSADYEGVGGIVMPVERVNGGREIQEAEVQAHCFRCCFVETLAKIAALVSTGHGTRPSVPARDEAECLREHPIFGLPDGVASLSREDGAAVVARLAEIIKASPYQDMARLQALLQDIEGQTSEALSRDDWWGKWGRHYTPSLMFAHKSQQCNNFKDPGVQEYGGAIFKAEQDAADDMFNQLPAPKPSVRRASYVSSAPVSMAAYNNCYGG